MRALILVDIQSGLTQKKTLFRKGAFMDTANATIKSFRDSHSKIIFVQHNNKQLVSGSPDWKIDSQIDK